MMETAAAASLPLLIVFILLFGASKKLPLFSVFCRGAGEGMRTCAKVLPSLIGLLLAVNMLRASGFPELLERLLGPLTEKIGISSQLLPLMFLRPVSGSGSSAYALSLMEQFGPDSETGRIAGVLAASTETSFYAVAVYFGSVGIRKTRYALPAALLGDFMAAAFAVLTVKVLA